MRYVSRVKATHLRSARSCSWTIKTVHPGTPSRSSRESLPAICCSWGSDVRRPARALIVAVANERPYVSGAQAERGVTLFLPEEFLMKAVQRFCAIALTSSALASVYHPALAQGGGIKLSDVAGTWEGKSMVGPKDSVFVSWVLTATADGKGWTVRQGTRDPVPS